MEQPMQQQRFTPHAAATLFSRRELRALSRFRRRLHRRRFAGWAWACYPRTVLAIAFVLGLIIADILMIVAVLFSGARL